MNVSPRSSRWCSTPRLLLVSGLLCLIGVLIVAYPSAMFFKHLFEDVVFPIREFDANTETVIDLPDTKTRYVIAASVNMPRGEAPETDLVLASEDGDVGSYETNGWITIMGHHYRSILIVDPPESGKLTVTAIAQDGEDYIVYRYHKDTIQRRLSETIPWWIAGGFPFGLGLGLLIFIAVRLMTQKNDLNLDLERIDSP